MAIVWIYREIPFASATNLFLGTWSRWSHSVAQAKNAPGAEGAPEASRDLPTRSVD